MLRECEINLVSKLYSMWAWEVALLRYLTYPVPGGIARPPGPLGTGPPGWGLGIGLTTLPCWNRLFGPQKLKNSIMDFVPVDERTCCLRLRGKIL
jgi:hypothetical protein